MLYMKPNEPTGFLFWVFFGVQFLAGKISWIEWISRYGRHNIYNCHGKSHVKFYGELELGIKQK